MEYCSSLWTLFLYPLLQYSNTPSKWQTLPGIKSPLAFRRGRIGILKRHNYD